MSNPWFNATLLAVESTGVMYLRMLRLAAGGAGAQAESELMLSEKLKANAAAAMTLLSGGSVETVIADYRAVVGANADRLLGPA